MGCFLLACILKSTSLGEKLIAGGIWESARAGNGSDNPPSSSLTSVCSSPGANSFGEDEGSMGKGIEQLLALSWDLGMSGRILLQLLPKYPFLGIWIVVFTVSCSGKQSVGGILQHHGAAARSRLEPSRGESPRRALQPCVSGFVFPLFSITPPLPGFSWGSRCVCSSGADLSSYVNICSLNSFGGVESIDRRSIPRKAGSLPRHLPAACLITRAFGSGAGP